MSTPAIAIVGMACRYPGANTPAQLWENILVQRRAFRPIPPERLSLDDYAPQKGGPDTTYVRYAGLLEGYHFDRAGHRISAASYHAADLCHWLALDVARDALNDAGFADAAISRRSDTGVLVGNSLAGEFSRAGQMRLRWPYVQRQIDAVLKAEGWEPDRRAALLHALERDYKQPFPVPSEESLAGGLSNTIAGRICNHFGLHGGGFTVDGACASSLLAVAQACSALDAGDLDMALAGGVDLSLDPFELVGFARTGALAIDRMRIYDERPTGFLPGEGCGFVVLMRHADAIAQGCHVHAVIRGWGISSDGQGGLTRPESSGQQMAMARACERAGINIADVPYFEGHGTGTAVGDAVELTALTQARKGTGRRPAAIGSIKALIGHTKAASGIAGLMKAALAVRHGVIPPSAGCEQPHSLLQEGALRVARRVESWPDAPRMAGINSLGFGGINVHVIIEDPAPAPCRVPHPHDRRLDSTAQDTELFVLDADNTDDAVRRLRELAALVARLSQGELPDLAASLATTSGTRPLRIAIVAANPGEASKCFEAAARRLETGSDIKGVEQHGNIYIGTQLHPPRIGFLFPGQGSPSCVDGGDWCRRFPAVEEAYNSAPLPAGEDRDTAVAQPAIVKASMVALQVLARLRIEATIAVGHSLGEISALAWAGSLSADAALRIALTRGQIMGTLQGQGAMASVSLSANDLRPWLKDTSLEIAAMNAPSQTVLSGHQAELELLLGRLREQRIAARRLPVSHAFHSRHVAAAEAPLRALLSGESPASPHRDIVSTVTGTHIDEHTNIIDLLCHQLTVPVRFLDALQEADAYVDLWIEAGPGTTLGRLAAAGSNSPAFSVDACGQGVAGLLGTVAATFVAGARPDLEVLFQDRIIRPFDWLPRQFLANPCERAPVADTLLSVTTGPEATDTTHPPLAPTSDAGSITGHLCDLLALRTELPRASITPDSRLLSDLHLNSIVAGQVIVEAARALGLPAPHSPMDFADARLMDIAAALSLSGPAGTESPALPEGLGHWLRGFRVEWQERPRLQRSGTAHSTSSWNVVARPGAFATALAERLSAQGTGTGIALLLEPSQGEDEQDDLFVAAAGLLGADREAMFLVVQGAPGAAGFARSVHLERHGTTVVVQVPLDHPEALQWVLDELSAAAGFTEARYDPTGRREQPAWQLVDLPETDNLPDTPVTCLPAPDEVLLVSGGGYGIGAECALALALRTGCALALLGRSRPGASDELDRHLARLDAHGVRWRYYVADVTDAQAVASAVSRARHELGPVAGILHASGINQPRLVQQVDAASLRGTLSPKLHGMHHLIAACEGSVPPRLLIAFGSIIARIGLAGQAEYALANERMAYAIERLAEQLPECRCLNIEWSVWSGTGMGERLGALDSLIRQGIVPIAPREGIAMLETILGTMHGPVSLVACSRFGMPSTIRFARDELPFHRFIERVNLHIPGVELIADAELSVDSDPYLAQHAYAGEQLLPAVVGLEAMAQAALALDRRTGARSRHRFDDVSFPRPISIPATGFTTLRIVALRRPSGIVDIALRSSHTGFQVDHFRGSWLPCDEADACLPGVRVMFDQAPLAIEPRTDIYGPLLPHGASFQRLQTYRQLSAEACIADIASGNTREWFRRDLPDTLLLGDPAMRDAAIHALQACIPHHTVLPVAIDRMDIRSVRQGPRQIKARERAREGKTLIYDLELRDASGDLAERWTGLRLRMVKEQAAPQHWPLPLLGPYLERRAMDLLPGPSMHMGMELGRRGDAHRLSAAMLDGLASITRHPDGRPLADKGYGLSHAYTGGLMLAVTGRRPLGCDLETVAPRTRDIWHDLLGATRLALAEQVGSALDEDLDTAATRVWTAMESMKKAGLPTSAPITIDPTHHDGWLILRSGTFAIAGTVLAVQSSERHVAIAIATELQA